MYISPIRGGLLGVFSISSATNIQFSQPKISFILLNDSIMIDIINYRFPLPGDSCAVDCLLHPVGSNQV